MNKNEIVSGISKVDSDTVSIKLTSDELVVLSEAINFCDRNCYEKVEKAKSVLSKITTGLYVLLDWSEDSTKYNDRHRLESSLDCIVDSLKLKTLQDLKKYAEEMKLEYQHLKEELKPKAETTFANDLQNKGKIDRLNLLSLAIGKVETEITLRISKESQNG